MPRKNRNRDKELVLPDNWDFEFDVGKSMGHNPNHRRSYVCATLINRNTGESFKLSKRGAFTKKEAHRMLEEILLHLVEQHVPKR